MSNISLSALSVSMAVLIISKYCSVWPLNCGCPGAVIKWIISRPPQNWEIPSAANCVPLSETISVHCPYWESSNSSIFKVCAVFALYKVKTFSHFEKASTNTNNMVLGNGLAKSLCRGCYGLDGTGYCASIVFAGPVDVCVHVAHSPAICSKHSSIFGQQCFRFHSDYACISFMQIPQTFCLTPVAQKCIRPICLLQSHALSKMKVLCLAYLANLA